MTTTNQNQVKISTCLEDPDFAVLLDEKNSNEIGRMAEGKAVSVTPDGSEKRVHGIVESVMNLHRCEDCAIRRQAAAKPNSIFARIHSGHATWWPAWKMYQAELRERAASRRIQNPVQPEEA